MDAFAPTLDVVTLGHAIVDVLAHCDDALVAAHGLVKGTMTLVDLQRSAAVYDSMPAGVEVSGGLGAGDVDASLVASARITYVEGYLVGLPSAEAALEAAVDAAHRAGRRVALTLSDPSWVALQRDAFAALLPEVDILLGNES